MFINFLDNAVVCLTNNATERALCNIALGRKAWLFAGSDWGGERTAALYFLITAAKLNYVNPLSWRADMLTSIADHLGFRLDELLPREWHHN